MIGNSLSHYDILEELGKGGMGVVYRARDTRLGRQVALKVLTGHLAKQPGALERFRREARLASSLNHPHICTIHDVGEDQGHPYIVMELLEGETLQDLTAREPLDVARAVSIAIQVSDALGAAHDQGVVHRDIKPSNIYVNSRGQAKVLDFGLAKLSPAILVADDSQTSTTSMYLPDLLLTHPGSTMGTIAYMSPEQSRGEELDARSDIFSFGAVLYKMVTGEQAFPGKTPAIVFDAVLNRQPTPASERNPAVPAQLQRIIARCLEKDREARYQSAAELAAELVSLEERLEAGAARQAPGSTASRRWLPSRSAAKWWLAGAVGAVLLATALLIPRLLSRRPALTEKDSLLLADFKNNTGEPVFDDTLMHALAVQLGQSPFLNVVPAARVRETLGYMGRGPEESVTGPVAREVCERLGAKAMLEGSIAALGSTYAITIQALQCGTGDVIAREQVEAENREKVLQTLDRAASSLRRQLGESLRSVEQYDVPLKQATTSSLDALRAFTLGTLKRSAGAELESIPFYKRALELDPDFASAYSALSDINGTIGELDLAEEYGRQAFLRRDRVSEREKLHITYQYHNRVTGQLDRSITALELWKHSYPRDFVPANALASLYNRIGQFEKALPEAEEALRRDPKHPFPYSNMAFAYRGLNRYPEARSIAEAAVRLRIETAPTRRLLYQIAVMQGDRAAVEENLAWWRGKPREYEIVLAQAQMAAFSGQLGRSHDLFRQAREMAERGGLKETAASIAASEAAAAAAFEDVEHAREATEIALSLAPGRMVKARAFAALPMVRYGGAGEAILDEALRRYPDDTLLNSFFVPLVRGDFERRRGNPRRAVELLELARPYELGPMPFWPIYVRGQAYLALRDGAHAAAEFRTIQDRRGVDPFSPLYPLAQLGLARAHALAGDKTASLKSYEELFRLWAEADPNVQLLREAQLEYESQKKVESKK